MIEGITVLSQSQLTDPNITVFVIVFMIVTVLSIILGLICNNLSVALIVIIIGTILSAYVSSTYGEPNGKYKYKVLIDDSVSVNQLLEKYEIVTHEGSVYTITDKERENEND